MKADDLRLITEISSIIQGKKSSIAQGLTSTSIFLTSYSIFFPKQLPKTNLELDLQGQVPGAAQSTIFHRPSEHDEIYIFDRIFH